MPSERPDIVSPAQPEPLHHRMRRLSGRLAGVGAIKIVAISSSTTAGEGDIVPYPQRLERPARGYTGRNIDVLNRGGVRQAKQTEEGKPKALSQWLNPACTGVGMILPFGPTCTLWRVALCEAPSRR